MGADLYMNDAYKKREKKLAPQIQEALDNRKANPDDEDAHQKAMDLYDKLYTKDVYFRDSYNSGSLMWSLGLSWWEDVQELIDNEGDLHPLQIQKLLNIIKSREVSVSNDFKADMPDEWTDEDALQYFNEQRDALVSFLQQAIDTNDTIGCSV